MPKVLIGDQVIWLRNDEKDFTVRRQPHVKDKDEKARLERIDQAARQLMQNGVKPTYRNLQKLGFGSKVINYWRKNVYNKIKEGQ